MRIQNGNPVVKNLGLISLIWWPCWPVWIRICIRNTDIHWKYLIKKTNMQGFGSWSAFLKFLDQDPYFLEPLELDPNPKFFPFRRKFTLFLSKWRPWSRSGSANVSHPGYGSASANFSNPESRSEWSGCRSETLQILAPVRYPNSVIYLSALNKNTIGQRSEHKYNTVRYVF
jgi:hypothetical protein